MCMLTLDQEYWNERHLSGDTPWDIKKTSPPLKAYIDQLTDKNISILIPGAGHFQDADYFYVNGFQNITICDISSVAVEKIKNNLRNKPEIKYINNDFFKLTGQYDLILEQTFFCAINPGQWQKYADKMLQLLSTNGKLVGVLFGKEFDQPGPPFGGNLTEYKTLFNSGLHILTMEMCYNSIPQRLGNELFFICKKSII